MSRAFTANRIAKFWIDSDLLIDLGEAGVTPTGATPIAATLVDGVLNDLTAIRSALNVDAEFGGAMISADATTHTDVQTASVIDTADVAAGDGPLGGAGAQVSAGQDIDMFLAGATTVASAATANVVPEQDPAASTVTETQSGTETFDSGPPTSLAASDLTELPPAPLLAATGDVETVRVQPAQVFELHIRPDGHDKPGDVDTIPMPEPPLAFERPTDNIMVWGDCADRPTLPGGKAVAGAFTGEALEAEVFEATPADASTGTLTMEAGEQAVWHDTGNWMLE